MATKLPNFTAERSLSRGARFYCLQTSRSWSRLSWKAEVTAQAAGESPLDSSPGAAEASEQRPRSGQGAGVVPSQQAPAYPAPQPPCPTCNGTEVSNGNGQTPMNASFVYAIGSVEPRFPRLAVEKEYAQITGRSETVGLSDRQVLQSALSDRRNRYLVRQLCWVLTIEGLETYILQPREPDDVEMLVEAVRPTPRPTDLDVVIGVRGPIAPAELCNGLMLPIVVCSQVYSFEANELIQAIPRPEKTSAEKFGPMAEELFYRIAQMNDNAGASDDHRALNYLAVRYPEIYATAASCFARDSSLTAVEVRPSRLSGARNLVDVIFSFTNRNTDVTEKYFVRVDVTEEFPFLVTKMQPYFERY